MVQVKIIKEDGLIKLEDAINRWFLKTSKYNVINISITCHKIEKGLEGFDLYYTALIVYKV